VRVLNREFFFSFLLLSGGVGLSLRLTSLFYLRRKKEEYDEA